jgi:glycosyltransferase involved in cell wall biosynthesis
MASSPIIFNGKFLSARPTGVHRVAGELITHIDRLLSDRVDGAAAPDGRWSLVCPRDAHEPLSLAVIQRRQAGLLTWQPWEQLELPLIARDAVLVNLCNLAPLSHRRSVTLIHDAQVFLSPGSYSKAFLAWYRFALPRIGAGAARLVTVSDYSRDRLAESGVAPRAAISVVPNGVDHLTGVTAETAILRRLGLTRRGFVLGAANAQSHKNVALLFEAFAAPDLGGLTLVLAGSDGAETFAAAGARPPAHVVFAGRVSDGELRALYENAACLAFPSTTEGFGLPPLEAMRLGCPAVVAPCGALPEVCGEAALYAPHDAAAAWAHAIRSLVDDSSLRQRMTEAGLRRAALYRWEDSARRLLEIIEAVADNGRG